MTSMFPLDLIKAQLEGAVTGAFRENDLNNKTTPEVLHPCVKLPNLLSESRVTFLNDNIYKIYYCPDTSRIVSIHVSPYL